MRIPILCLTITTEPAHVLGLRHTIWVVPRKGEPWIWGMRAHFHDAMENARDLATLYAEHGAPSPEY